MLSAFLAQLNFNPDAFQQEAMDVIDNGHSVVVCSPTGSGKTLVAEFAAFKAVKENKKIFYTTPLKALSNQKFHDFKKEYGEHKVGLLTGDLSIQRDANILVMTTEVFRNMLYGIQDDGGLLSQVGYVVLDECHYMNDADRGTVWEESMIYCPDNIQIIALSATIANALELTDWINEVHHNTELVSSDFRPVPLRFFYFTREELLPLFKHDTKQLNSRLKFDNKGKRMPRQLRAFEPNKLIMELQYREMLPAIFFTFSRKGCDKYLFETRGLEVITDEERRRLKTEIDAYVASHPFLENNRHIKPMRHGFASHHAGLLPAVKHLVEKLFQMGLIKVVFATETLAAGINMPARTTVITAISKRTNDGHRILTASEFLQMSGRAGRRGMDEVGYVVTVSSPYESAHDVSQLASSPADPLNSQFTPTYGMVLNLLQKHNLKEAEFLLSKSFGNFTAERRLQPLRDDIAYFISERDALLEFECPYNLTNADFEIYLSQKERLKESQKLVKIYRSQLKKHGNSPEMMEAMKTEEARRNTLNNGVQGVACYTCQVYKTHIQQGEKLDRVQRKIRQLSRRLEEEGNLYWQQFMNHYRLLKEAGCINQDDYPTEAGLLTAEIRAENEFYLAQVIMQGLLDDLDYPQLAAVVCALVNDSNRDNQFSRMHVSPQVRHVLGDVHRMSRQLLKLQARHRIDTPMLANPVASGLVEAWAQETPWTQLVMATSIDEGDLVRMMRRTADMLRQISRSNRVPNKLSENAKLALKAMYRDPIRDEADMMLPPGGTEDEQATPEA